MNALNTAAALAPSPLHRGSARVALLCCRGGSVQRQVCVAATLLCIGAPAPADWTHFAGSPQRVSVTDALPGAAGDPKWILSHDGAGAAITFIGQAGIVAHGGGVFAVGRVENSHLLFAADARSGSLLWSAPVPAAQLNSWSTPAIDVRNSTVIVASGAFITALDAGTGTLQWQTPLARGIVNASPVVTDDLGDANRIFITDYDGFGTSGHLYAINTDPFDAAANPHQPGDIVWSVVLGTTSGNTPAYRDGIVYVASVSDSTGTSPGQVRAFPADAAAAPQPLWTFTNPAPHGFFGGVAVQTDSADMYVYAASYAMYGGQFAANMVKINATDGSLAWSVPANRSAATPVPLAGGRVLLSGGIRGFGAFPSVQLFADHSTSAELLWDSALDSWRDLNNNGVMDPGEYLVIGGWTHQPIASEDGARIVAGVLPAQSFSAGDELFMIDLDRHPLDPAFIASQAAGAGSTPAAANELIFTVGPGGLHALGGPECWANCTGATAEPLLTVSDFLCFIDHFAAASSLPWQEQVAHYANCDGATAPPVLTIADFLCFIDRFAMGCE